MYIFYFDKITRQLKYITKLLKQQNIEDYQEKNSDVYKGCIRLNMPNYNGEYDSLAEEMSQIYLDENNNIAVDTSWVSCVMPSYWIKHKHLSSLRRDIDSEINSENRDIFKLIKQQNELDKLSNVEHEDLIWIDVALSNLDKRVANGESDKPIIRQKLNDKLNELRNKS